MDFNNSWEALVKPGKADNYFDIQDIPRLEPFGREYDGKMAWVLAEVSRLIYNPDESARHHFLEKVGLRERIYFDQNGTQGAIVEGSKKASNEPVSILVFRGTSEIKDWITNLRVIPQEWAQGGLVHQGFARAFDIVWRDLREFILSVEHPIFYTGHSLGAALATLAASRKRPFALYTFGSPRVGDAEFGKALSGIAHYRIVNNSDVTTILPPPLGFLNFQHFGELRYINRDSSMLINPNDKIGGSDRLNKVKRLGALPNLWRSFIEPPVCLADHAPINYVAHLERQL